MKPSRPLAIAGVLAMLGVAMVLIGPTDSFVAGGRHADGQGPLASVNSPEGRQEFTADPRGRVAWTFGVPLCRTGDAHAILVDVVPHRTEGSGFAHLGTLVRRVDLAVSETIISVDGYPPPYPGLSSVSGFEVTSACEPRPPTDLDELDIGFGSAGDTGGGWRGIDVRYTVDGRAYVLEVRADFIICPAATPDCGPAPPDG